MEVVSEGKALALGPHQQRAVLAVLVLSSGEVVTSDRLIGALWGERPPATAAKTVQVYVSRLRKTLNGAQQGTAAPEGLIVTADGGYVLRADCEQVDVCVFKRLLDRGRDAFSDEQFDTAATVLRQALGLWRGAPLADFTFDAFAAPDIAVLEELRLEALEIRIDADLALGRHAALVAELEALTTEHPLRERLRRQLMLALYRCGREPEALELYRRTRGTLVDELGMEPSAALRDLHDAMLRQDPALAPPAVPPRPPPTQRDSAVGASGRRVALAAATLALLGGVSVVIALVAGTGGSSSHVAANSVAVIDPIRNAVVQQVAVGTRPGAISAGAGGLWVANLDDRSASEIEPRSGTRIRTVSLGGAAVDALAAGAGAVWTTDFLRGTATPIDPAFGDPLPTVQLGPTPWDAGSGGITSAIAVAGHSVWAAIGNATVALIDARTRRVTRIPVGNDPAGIAAVGRTAWVSDDTDNTVSHIDADGVIVGPLPVGGGASGIAIGYGSVWVANTLADTVTRIDPTTGATKRVINVGERPHGVAVGAGAVWVADAGGASVTRIDPRTDHARTINVGGSPDGVAVDAGRVWVTVQAAPRPPGKPVAGGTLRIVQSHDFGSTDPAIAFSFGDSARQLEYATCAKLLDYPDLPAPAGTRLAPEVAAALPRVSRGGRVYRFAIKPGFRFSPPSDRAVTAFAFQRAIERLLAPHMPSPWTDMADIVGARAYRQGRTSHLAGVTATADTLTIRLVRPSGSLPARMAMPEFCAVPPDTPARSGALDQIIPSAGPYYIVSHTPDSQLVLRRNPNYRGPRPARFGQIEYRFGATPAQDAALVKAGNADYADDELGQLRSAGVVSPEVDANLRHDFPAPAAALGRSPAPRPHYSVHLGLTSMYLLLNDRRPLFASMRMRRAVNFAVDRPALARSAIAGFSSVPADQYLPPSMPGYRDAHVYPLAGPDLPRARNLAGGHRGHAVMYTCNTGPCRAVGEIVKADLRPIGIAVTVHRFAFPAVFDRERAPRARYDIGWFGWFADYADPSQFIDPSVPGFGVATPRAGVRRYHRQAIAAAALSGPRRLQAYGRLDVDLARHLAPVAAFADVTARDFLSARVGCQTYQPFYGMDLARLCIRNP
jgi:YVTN family beta-propeller protein